jgi:hypothetical protein
VRDARRRLAFKPQFLSDHGQNGHGGQSGQQAPPGQQSPVGQQSAFAAVLLLTTGQQASLGQQSPVGQQAVFAAAVRLEVRQQFSPIRQQASLFAQQSLGAALVSLSAGVAVFALGCAGLLPLQAAPTAIRTSAANDTLMASFFCIGNLPRKNESGQMIDPASRRGGASAG